MANQVLYGFTSLADVFGQRVNEVGVEAVSTAIDATVAEHNRQMNALLDLFAERTTQFKMRYKTPAAARLQPLDEYGVADPIRRLGYYDVAFPIQKGGTAWGETYESMVKMTVAEANDITNTLITADMRWMRDHILAALFTNASWTFSDEEHGSLTIKGLANADTDVYLIQSGADAGAVDSHYAAQAGAIGDAADPFPTIYTELMEHPENSGEVISFIPTANKAVTEGLTDFHPIADPNIRLGSGSSELIGSLGVAVPGQVIGYHDAGVWLVEWRSLPSNYVISVCTGGDRPLAMREEPEPELQGFYKASDQMARHPFYKTQWERKAGFGAKNRVAAHVQRVGNGTYAIPTGYTSPMG